MDAGSDASTMDAAVQDANTPTDATTDATAPDAGPTPIAIVGIWTDDTYVGDGDMEITATMYGASSIIEYDNTTRYAIVTNPFQAGTYNKIVWTPLNNGSFYQCTQDYGKATVAEAKATTMKADPSNPTVDGCGNADFYWSHYIPAIEIRGEWQSDDADFHVDSDAFSDYAIQSYDNAADKAVLSTGGGDAGLLVFKKLVWTVVNANRAYYCVLAANFTTQAEAEASTATADASMPTAGCNGGAWSSLSK
jgi:hypothetical protein